MRRATIALLALGATLCGCGGSGGATPPTPPPGTGIDLLTVASPTCPVLRQGQPPSACERPISVRVVVERGTATVTEVQTGADGRARVPLPAGVYTLLPQSTGGALPRPPAPSSATVVDGTYSPVTLRYDTGIR